MNDSQMTNEGLNGGLRQSHQAINLCIMTTLITLAASAEMIFDDQMVSFCSNLTIFSRKCLKTRWKTGTCDKNNTDFLVLLSGECSSSSAMYFVIRLGDNPTAVPLHVHYEPRSKADWWMLVDFLGHRSCSSHHSCQCNHFNVFIWQWLVSRTAKFEFGHFRVEIHKNRENHLKSEFENSLNRIEF